MTEPLVPRGIEPLCGWQWVYGHWHNLDGFVPTIEIVRPGSKYTIRSNDTKVLNAAIKEITRADRTG